MRETEIIFIEEGQWDDETNEWIQDKYYCFPCATRRVMQDSGALVIAGTKSGTIHAYLNEKFYCASCGFRI